jgi:prepilin-type N-terminal cleavage/methylation domain-containing protein
MRRHKYSGFTLIELIVVIAISVILLSIMIVPVIQGFNITRAAQGFSEVQSEGRRLISQLEREIANAAAVRPTSGISGTVSIVMPDDLNVNQTIDIPYAKIDIYPPAEGDASNQVGGAYVDPDTGKADPTLKAPKGDPDLPAAPGMTLVRYWIGLRDPLQPYKNPYSNYRTSTGARWNGNPVSSAQDNLYVLYRAEVQPRVLTGGGALAPNTEFFDVDVNGNPIIDEPDFFLNTAGVDPAQDTRAANWRRVGRIVSQFSRFDMIMPEFNKQNNRLILDGAQPRFVPLVRFQPARVSAETIQNNVVLQSGYEIDNAAKAGFDSARTQYGSWDVIGLSIWPSTYPSVFGPLTASAGSVRNSWATGAPSLYAAKDPGLGMVIRGSGTNDLLFSIDNYLRTRGMQTQVNAAYPFTQSVAPAATLAPWNTRFIPVFYDTRSGSVTASFDIREVGSDVTVPYQYRVPTTQPMATSGAPVEAGIHVGLDTAFAAEVNAAAIPWENAMTDIDIGVNRRFSSLWANWATLAPTLDRAQWCKRFIDLRAVGQPGGVPSPLDRRTPANGGSGWTRPQITPGSEEIVGPDQRPGANYGKYVRYTRTTSRPVGPNQYYINYVDQPEPDWSTLGFTANYDPTFYDPDDFVSAVLQAQYRAGYIEFNSQLGEPIPGITNDPTTAGDDQPGNFLINYRFQFTEPRDIVAVDYDSTEMMEIILTVRNYPQTSIPNPQYMTLKGSAAVRNFTR